MDRVTVLTDRFDRALLYATHVHGGQVRKGTSTPYIAHLLAVSATVLEYGGDEDLAIAALLHDSAEDQGGKARLEDVRNRFGGRVARVVALLTQPKASERRTGRTERRPISRISTPPMTMFCAFQSFAICESPMSAKASGPVSANLAIKRCGTIAALPTSSAKGGPGNWLMSCTKSSKRYKMTALAQSGPGAHGATVVDEK